MGAFSKGAKALGKVENIGDGVKGLGKSAGSKVKDFEKAAGGIKNSSKVGISNAERVKFKNWEYPLSDDLYLKYKNVYDNPKYYNQETGALSWPPNNGFVKGTEKVDILKPGTIIDRYGEPTGEFLAPMGDSHIQVVRLRHIVKLVSIMCMKL